MTLTDIGTFLLLIGSTIVALAINRKRQIDANANLQEDLLEPLPEAQNAPVSDLPTETIKVPMYDFSTPKKAYHSVRVICDEEGLSVNEKNLICSVIYGESEFDQNAVCKNRDAQGNVTSRDISICQVNTFFHIGKGKTFPSEAYVMANQDKVVRWMIKCYRQGHLKWWVAYSSGRSAQFLKPNSPMWALKS